MTEPEEEKPEPEWTEENLRKIFKEADEKNAAKKKEEEERLAKFRQDIPNKADEDEDEEEVAKDEEVEKE